MINKSLQNAASEKITERLTWQTAQRDQAGITKKLSEGEDIEEIYGLGEAGLFDEFFGFLDEFKITNIFKMLEPKERIRNSNVNFHTVVLIYKQRIVSGVSFFWHISPVLLQSQSLMRLVGFNAKETKEGTSHRGNKKNIPLTEEDKKTEKGQKKIRGPICADSVAEYIDSIPEKGLEVFFNKIIKILSDFNFFPKQIHAILDSSEIESTEKCEGCGMVKKEKPPELKNRRQRIKKIVEQVFGFKIWVVWDPNSKLPLAMRFSKIEVADNQMAKEVIEQAINNIGGHSKFVSIVIDRGFMDGKLLWWLEEKGILFYIPAKANMDIYKDALALTDTGIHQTREKKRSEGAGKNKKNMTDSWELVGVEGLTSASFYSELGSGSHTNQKDFNPNPINAVVVMKDPYIEKHPDSSYRLIILTNDKVNNPFHAYDRYDERSEIENSLFREAKQSWFIERPSKNTITAYRAHAYLTIIIMALTTAFRGWMDKQDELEKKGKETGIRNFRETVRQENGNKLIVFYDNSYAIFEAYEIAILLGRNVRKPNGVAKVITKEDILKKYCVLIE
jgi:hypothetical protein